MMQLRIWSNEHGAWWRPGAWGYTPDIGEAGWFTGEETLRFLYGSACGSLPGKPNEVAVDGSLRFVLELQREMVRGAMAGARGTHAMPMGYGRRFANYTKQNGTDRLTPRQRRRWHKKYFRAGRVITDD